jgi:hypothetical protein
MVVADTGPVNYPVLSGQHCLEPFQLRVQSGKTCFKISSALSSESSEPWNVS